MKSKILVGFAVALILSGCEESGQRVEPSSNSKLPVTLMLEHDGCKVYRFQDYRPVYFTTCEGSVSSAAPCGKNCSHMDENRTTINGKVGGP